MAEPIYSLLCLIKNIDLDNTYEHTIDFETKEEQAKFFQDKASLILSSDDYSYIRRNENIKVFSKIDSLLDYNYLFFDNGDKRHYCFITDKRYVNDETTELIIQEDVMQTYMFNYQLSECFVEREHTDRYDKYKNPIYSLINENLNYGDEYKIKSESKHVLSFPDGTPIYFMYILADSKITYAVDQGYFIDEGIPTGYYTYVLPLAKGKEITWTDSEDVDHTMYSVQALSLAQTRDALFANEHVKEIFISPVPPANMSFIFNKLIFNGSGIVTAFDNFLGNGEGSSKELPGLICLYSRTNGENNESWEDITITYDEFPAFPSTPNVDDPYAGLEPNAYRYPYTFKKISYGGEEMLLKPQYRGPGSLRLYQSLSDEGTVVLDGTGLWKPNNFDLHNNERCITNQSPAYVNLSTPAWSQYMLQNKAQRQAGFASAGIGGAIGVVSGLAAGGPFGLLAAAGSAISTGVKISQQLAKEKDIKNQPDDIRQFNGDISQLIATENINVKIRTYAIFDTFLKQIKDYFHHYGYKVNDLHVPNLKTRYNFNYIKNLDTNIKCNLNNDIKNQIKDIYNKGITFWHYHPGKFAGVREYNNNNYEVKLLQGETQQ